MPVTAPTCLTAVALSATSVRLHWKNGIGQTSVQVLRQTGGAGPFTSIATLGPKINSYTDATVVGGTLYTYEIEAVGP